MIFMASRSVALLTDFGNKDSYVAIMKATILPRVPDAVLVDITHDIEPFNVIPGARVLQQAFRVVARLTAFCFAIERYDWLGITQFPRVEDIVRV